jgi:hypothetical protein
MKPMATKPLELKVSCEVILTPEDTPEQLRTKLMEGAIHALEEWQKLGLISQHFTLRANWEELPVGADEEEQ